MSTVFEFVDVTGISTTSIEDAVKAAITHVAKTRSIGWFEVLSQRGRMIDADTLEYQVTVRCGVKG